MRKSAVSVRSGAGMPVHMAGERNAGGGDGKIQGRERKGPYVMSLHYIWEETQHR